MNHASRCRSKGDKSSAPLPRSAPLFNETIHHWGGLLVFSKLSAWFRVTDSAIRHGDPSASEGEGTNCIPGPGTALSPPLHPSPLPFGVQRGAWSHQQHGRSRGGVCCYATVLKAF